MLFSFIDWIVLGIYLAVVIGIGVLCSKRQVTTEEFFLGGRRFGGFAVGLSVLGAGLSAITFLGVPGYVFNLDWTLFISGAVAVFSILVVAKTFVPFFFRSPHASSYEYLNSRFDQRVATLAGSLFLLMRGLLAGIAIYAPALALSVVSGWELWMSIVVIGVATMIYTTLGGMSAVIWTDVMQVIVLFSGALFVLWKLCVTVPGDVGTWYQTLASEHKLNFLDMEWSWVRLTFWTSLFGGFVFGVAAYGVDQVMVQRYMSSRSLPDAKSSLYWNAWYTIPTLLIFFSIGSMLYLFSRSSPDAFPKGLSSDQILPYYIVNYLPHGFSALVIAAIFAAAMSTLSAVLNSLATITVTDFYKRFFRKGESDYHYVRMGQLFTALWGSLAIGAAFLSASISSQVSLAAVKAAGLFIGPLLGLFLLGIFFRKVSASGAFYGGLAGLLLSLLAGFATPLHEFWLTMLGAFATLLIGLSISFSHGFSYLRAKS